MTRFLTSPSTTQKRIKTIRTTHESGFRCAFLVQTKAATQTHPRNQHTDLAANQLVLDSAADRYLYTKQLYTINPTINNKTLPESTCFTTWDTITCVTGIAPPMEGLCLLSCNWDDKDCHLLLPSLPSIACLEGGRIRSQDVCKRVAIDSLRRDWVTE